MVKAKREDAVAQRLKVEIEAFKERLPLLQEIATPALEDRHWAKIFSSIGQKFEEGMKFSADDLVKYKIMDKLEEVRCHRIMSMLSASYYQGNKKENMLILENTEMERVYSVKTMWKMLHRFKSLPHEGY